MVTAKEVAQYFLFKDPERNLFNRNVVTYNHRKFYEGNLRLNKYLFLSQVVYLAKYEIKLFEDNFLAFDNGPIIESIMNSYGRLIDKNDMPLLDDREKVFLDKIFLSLENATFEELIEITHEDPEWKRLCKDTYCAPVMNIEDNLDEYKKRYDGLIKALKI